MRIIEIARLDALELRAYAQLTNAQLRSKLEPENGIFIAESPKVIATALAAGCRPLSFLTERKHLAWIEKLLPGEYSDLPVYTADREMLAGLTGYTLTRGVLCEMRRPSLPDLEELCAGARRIAVLENVVDATNVGAIFRSAAALGMDAVLVTPSCCDPLCRRAVRVSMGAVFQIPWTRIGKDASDWPEPGISRLRQLGYKTVAMALRSDSISIDDPALAAAGRLAVILGAEGDGLSAATIADCDFTARIPMSRGVDSLNVAAAGAVIFWQLSKK